MIRRAHVEDVKCIQQLINHYAKSGQMLPRSLSELYESIRDFLVYEEDGQIYGCSALHVSWENLAEVKSLAVDKAKQKKGIGRQLLQACLDEARKLKIKKVFVLTEKVEFFKKSGFKQIAKAELPQKIWAECINCVKFPDCNESAVMIELDKE